MNYNSIFIFFDLQTKWITIKALDYKRNSMRNMWEYFMSLFYTVNYLFVI